MIIADFTCLGREVVVEYEPNASWHSWGHVKEGPQDTHTFLGKLTVVHTNHWRQRVSFPTVALAVCAAGIATSAFAHGLSEHLQTLRDFHSPH